MEKVASFCGRWVWYALGLVVLCNIGLNVLGPDEKVLDLFFGGYSFEEATAQLSAMGSDGIARYRNVWFLDMVYPLAYAVAYTGVVWRLVSKPLGARWYWVSLLPPLSALFDYAENICLKATLDAWPQTESVTTELFLSGRIFTPGKWILALITISLMLGGLIGLIVRRLRKRV